MRCSGSLVSSLLLLAAGAAQAASSWSFNDGTISVTSKKGADGIKEKLNAKTPISKAITLEADSVAKIILTATDNGKGKRPHQAFLLLKDEVTGLEAPFPLNLKESGKASVSISQKDIPLQLLLSSKPLHGSIVIGSFGSSSALLTGSLFDLSIRLDPNTPAPPAPTSLRYGKQPEIHHIFRAAERTPPAIISLVFALAVLSAPPVLAGVWLALGANLDHLPKALNAAPISHAAFLGSIVAMEGVFFMYYTRWNLFQTLPVAGAVGIVAVLSGVKALGEVQGRRLKGER